MNQESVPIKLGKQQNKKYQSVIRIFFYRQFGTNRELSYSMRAESRGTPMFFNKYVQNAISLKGPILLVVLLFLMHLGHPSEIRYPHAHLTLLALALLQMAEAWIVLRRKEESENDWPSWREISILAGTMLLCYFFVLFTGRMQSKYGLIFLLPILTGSTRFPLRGAQLVALTSVVFYGSFYFTDHTVSPEDLPEETLELSIIIFFSLFIGFLVNFARLQEKSSQWRLRQAADEIAAANLELQKAREKLEEKVNELETMEQAIRRADRLAALGEMSAGLAHEIRSPLGVIQSSTELIGKKILALEPDNRLVSVILEEIIRLNHLVEEFLSFASPPKPNLRIHNLSEIIHRTVRLVEPKAEKQGVRFKIAPSNDSVPLCVDENLLHQCILNLLLNALDVMPAGGRIQVDIKGADSDDEARIIVQDTGPGITADAESRIFNPFYTTKENGTGLGLAIVQQIVTMHGGRVEVANAREGGAMFTLRLPVKATETESVEVSP
jgi:signal transduction histidine kinase